MRARSTVTGAGQGRRLVVVLLALALAGCGRFGYDALLGDDDGTVDAGDAADGGLARDDAAPSPVAGDGGSAELPVSASTGDARAPALVWTGSSFLVVWDDDRAPGREIYFTRLDADGVKQRDDRQLSVTGGNSCCAAAAWDGQVLGVVHENGRQDQIDFMRLDDDGSKLGAVIVLTPELARAFNPAIAWNGSEVGGFGVVFDDDAATDSEVYFVGVDGAGDALGAPVAESAAAGRSTFASLAWDGSEFGFAWEDERGGAPAIYASRCDTAGTAVGSERTISPEGQAVSLAWSGTSFGAAWQRVVAGQSEVFFARFAPGTAPLNAVRVSDGELPASAPSLVWTGERFALAYVEGDVIMLAEIDTSGTVLGTPRWVAGNDLDDAAAPALVWADGSYGLAWEDDRNGNWGIFFREVTP